METAAFDRMTRDELVAKARALGVERAELMTRVELQDEIVRRQEPDPTEQRRVRGWLGVARDLVASVVESGLNLPDAAALIRGRGDLDFKGPPPVATVTLAQIYAAQGHHARAISVIDEVLAKEPDHAAARALRERFLDAAKRPAASARNRDVLDVEGAIAEDTPFPPVGLPPVAGPAPAAVEARAPEPEPAPVPANAPKTAAESRPGSGQAPCVLIARAERAAPEVVWDLGGWTAPSEAELTLRFIAWTASEAGLSERAGELPLPGRRGRARLPDVEPRALVRAALGHRGSGTFVPLMIASEIVISNGSLRVGFRPPPALEQNVLPVERDLVLALSPPS